MNSNRASKNMQVPFSQFFVKKYKITTLRPRENIQLDFSLTTGVTCMKFCMKTDFKHFYKLCVKNYL